MRNLPQAIMLRLRYGIDAVSFRRPDSRRIHEYWIHPDDGANKPEDYVKPKVRSAYLANCVGRHASRTARILEIGCNAGRNLAQLDGEGYHNLTAVEISADAIAFMNSAYPGLQDRAKIIHGAVEDVIRGIPDKSFDLVFTMAVLEHIHSDSKWVFAEIVRIAKTIITIEDEWTASWRHFPRNYRRVFERLGAKQIDYGAQIPDLPESFRYRAFTAPR